MLFVQTQIPSENLQVSTLSLGIDYTRLNRIPILTIGYSNGISVHSLDPFSWPPLPDYLRKLSWSTLSCNQISLLIISSDSTFCKTKLLTIGQSKLLRERLRQPMSRRQVHAGIRAFNADNLCAQDSDLSAVTLLSSDFKRGKGVEER